MKKFCVVTPGRTGSTSLMRALQAIEGVKVPAADIDCPHNELLVPEQLNVHLQAYRALTGQPIATPQDLIEAFFTRHHAARFAGFKTMHNRHSDWQTFFARPDIQFITLRRRDVASTVASLVIAIERQHWDRTGGPQEQPWTFLPKHAQLVARMTAHVFHGNRLLGQIPRAIALMYEDLCQPGFRDPALDGFFGCPVAIERPQPPVSGSAYVTNWSEFVRFMKAKWVVLSPPAQQA